MADPKFQPENFRQVLGAGYAFIRSIEMNKAMSSVTMDRLIQDHINALKKDSVRASAMVEDIGPAEGNRMSRWDQVDELEKLFKAAVQSLQDAGGNTEKLAELGVDPTKEGDYVSSSGTATIS